MGLQNGFGCLEPLDEVGALDFNFGREGVIIVHACELRLRRVFVVAVNAPLLHVGKEGLELVEVACLDRVKFVIMTFRAAKGASEPGCSDEVTLFVKIEPDGGLRLRAELGPDTRTLTRALVTILCRGLNGSDPALVAALPDDFIPEIVGEPLLRSRSRSVYGITSRLREAVRSLLARAKPEPPNEGD
jgi:sulfur transfer protein SufE